MKRMDGLLRISGTCFEISGPGLGQAVCLSSHKKEKEWNRQEPKTKEYREFSQLVYLEEEEEEEQ